ncbi:porin [Methylomagnum ishizawai]|uniref:Porin n=1 Tax=Methylomagnum ishizawai TaxID=1760988 RepID=A0A1Y6CZI7_9GAMM|nr:porin [Methylomagnum ishizawai]SMF96098.1 porin [Methylomagnum ishizawai]
MLPLRATWKPGLAAALLALPAATSADTPTWSFKGFGTLSVSGTDTDLIQFRRDTTQGNGVTRTWGVDPDSRLGLQLDVDFGPSWRAGIQWVARNHAGQFIEQNLDWAFLRWSPEENLDFRVGRLGFDVFMLSDYRNVGYAYPWMRPPHEFYASLPTYHFDGIDLSHKTPLGGGYLTAKSFVGYASYTVPSFLFDLDLGAVIVGGSLGYESGDWRARLGYNYAKTKTDLPIQPLYAALDNPWVNTVWPGANTYPGMISPQNRDLHYISAGLAYDDGGWLAQLEASYTDSQVVSFPSVASGYLSLGRRAGPVTFYTLLGISETLRHTATLPRPWLATPAVDLLWRAADSLINANSVDEKSVSLGLRWDVYENIDLKAQWSHYWLGQNGAQLWVEPELSAPTPGQVDVWSLGVDFVF